MKNRDLQVLSKKFIDPLGIGFMCVGCTGSSEHLMEAHIYDLDNIIRLGNHERAAISAEVLMEKGIMPDEAAEKSVFDVMEQIVNKYESGDINRIQLAKSALTAIKALNSIEREASFQGKSVFRGTVAFVDSEENLSEPEIVLAKAVYESCGYKPQDICVSKEAEIALQLADIKDLKQVIIRVKSGNERQNGKIIDQVKDAGLKDLIFVWGETAEPVNLLKIPFNSYCKEALFGVKILLNALMEKIDNSFL